ncbi:MAG: FtsX-like permease family protein [Gammaproteobacteria bacterium]
MTRRAWLWFRRGMRSELRLALATLTLAAAVTSGIALFSAQLERTVNQAADGALGADLVVRSHDPLPPTLTRLGQRLGLVTTTETSFPSVAVAGERLKLASVRALAAPYPLRGTVELRTQQGAPAKSVSGVPPPGSVWASPALVASLGQTAGGTLSLGRSQFRIAAFIVRAPGATLDLTGIAPLLIMNRTDLAQTGLAGNQSRVNHELLFAGTPQALQRFRNQSRSLLPAGATLRDINDVNPGLRAPLTTTLDFLRLAVLTTLLIAAAALIQCARHYLSRQRRSVAILKTLGASRGTVRGLYTLELIYLALAASLAGAVLGWALARGFGVLGEHWFHLNLAPTPLTALFSAPVTVAILAAGFWLAPVLSLPATRPVQLLRGEVRSRRHAKLQLSAALLALLALLFTQGAGRIGLTLWTLAAGIGLAVFVGGIGYVSLHLLGAPSVRLRPAWRYGLGNLARNRARSLGELIAFGLVLSVILLLTGVRHDLTATWRARLPANAPDHFIVNIQPAQRTPVTDFLTRNNHTPPPMYAMVRARLTAIDSTPVAAWGKHIQGQRSHELLQREQTLSMRARVGTGNELVAGHWWRTGDAGQHLVSADSDWAKRLHVKLGDTLTFTVAGQTLTLRIASLRKIKWQSFEPNFFLVTPPGTLDAYPKTWITAVHAGNDESSLLKLLQRFPNLTIINVGTILDAIQNLLRHAALALAAIFTLSLIAALLVLLATLQAIRDERTRELALLRVLGARRRLLVLTLATEFTALGALAGLAAGIIAAGTGYALGRWVLNLNAGFDAWLVLAGVLAGTIVIGLTGLAATYGLTRVVPTVALRRSQL